MVLGDFNEIVEHGEKWGRATRARDLMEDFKGALTECRLSDLGASGPKFTWYNKRRGSDFMKKRLDRAIVNKLWCEFFPHAEVAVLANRASDHNPLLLTLNACAGGAVNMRRPFRYEARWSKLGGFKEVVRKA